MNENLGRTQGWAGWSPVPAIADRGDDKVMVIADFVGGEDNKPTSEIGKYVGVDGLVADIGDAVPLPKGATGEKPKMNSTSITSNVIGTGAKTFTLATPLDMVVGEVVKAYSLADPTNYVCGYIFSITPTEIVITVSEIGGVGTKTDWVIALGAFKGTTGITTPNLPNGTLALRYSAGTGSAEAGVPVGFYMGSDGKFYNGLFEVSTGGSGMYKHSNPVGAHFFINNTSTGAIRLKPNQSLSGFGIITGSIFNYGTGETTEFLISFYTGSMYYGATAIFSGGKSYPVRWYGGTENSIYIGDVGTTHQALSVSIDYARSVLGNPFLISTGWTISLETSFVGTLSVSRTAEQTLPNPGLNYPMTGYNAASGTETDVTPSTSPLQAFQNIEKKLGNRYTKPQSLAVANPMSFYFNMVASGMLITTDILVATAQSFLINIKTYTGSSSFPNIDIEISGSVANNLTQVTGISRGGNLYDDIKLLQINNKLCVWFPASPFKAHYVTAYSRPNNVGQSSTENKVSAIAQSTATQPAQDVGSFTPQIVPITNVVLTKNKPLNTGSSGTLGIVNQAEYIRYTANATLTIPTNAAVPFPIGTRIDLTVLSTFTLTIVASGGVTVNGLSNIVGYGKGYIRKIGTDEWDLVKNDATKILNTGSASNLYLGDGTTKPVSDFVLATQKGAANGVVPLNASTLIDQIYLPSYVDDIIEGYKSGANFYKEVGLTTLITGETGKIYVDLTTGQNSKQYRWSGSAYIQITNGLIASTNDVPEGGSNLYFTVARVLATVISGFSAAAGVVANTDTILQAINKIVGNITAVNTALALKADIAASTGTLVALTFTSDSVQGTIASPLTGNITGNITGAKLGVVTLVIHNHTTAPTFDSKYKKLSGSGSYVTGSINYIFCEYINDTEIIYSINQRT